MYLLYRCEELREVCCSVSLSALLSGATDISPEAELIQRGHDTCTHHVYVEYKCTKTQAGKTRGLIDMISLSHENSLDTSVSEWPRFPESFGCECLSTEPSPTSRSVSRDWSFESNDWLHLSSCRKHTQHALHTQQQIHIRVKYVPCVCVWPAAERGRRPVSGPGTGCWWETPAWRTPGRIGAGSPRTPHTDEVWRTAEPCCHCPCSPATQRQDES